MTDSTPAGIPLVLMGVNPPLVLSSVEGRVCAEQEDPVKTANFETRCGASYDKYILSRVEGYIPSSVEGYILSRVEGYILSRVEGLTTSGELGKLAGVE